MRPYLDPWAKIYFLGLVSLIFRGQGTGFPKPAICFLLLCAPGQRAIGFLFFMENIQQSHPGSTSYTRPTCVKCNSEGKEKHLGQPANWCLRLHTTPLRCSTVTPQVPFCVLTCSHFPQVLPSTREQVWNFSFNTSLVGSHQQMNNGKDSLDEVTNCAGFAIVKVKPWYSIELIFLHIKIIQTGILYSIRYNL